MKNKSTKLIYNETLELINKNHINSAKLHLIKYSGVIDKKLFEGCLLSGISKMRYGCGTLAYLYYNLDVDININDDIIYCLEKALKFGYYKWPVKIMSHIKGKKVCDVGCGAGVHSIGMISMGATTYLGLDPKVTLDSDVMKTKTKDKKVLNFGKTLKAISNIFYNIEYLPGTFEDVEINKKFDVISMHTVTEHLMNLEEVIAGCVNMLDTGGKIILLHDNFFGWNGHHMPPKTLSSFDASNSEHLELVDWNHISYEPPKGHFIHECLNKIKLDELREIIWKYFDVVLWHEQLSGDDILNRLSDSILQRNQSLSRRDLSVNWVYCIAKKR